MRDFLEREGKGQEAGFGSNLNLLLSLTGWAMQSTSLAGLKTVKKKVRRAWFE